MCIESLRAGLRFLGHNYNDGHHDITHPNFLFKSHRSTEEVMGIKCAST